MKNNKWTIEIKKTYIVDVQNITRTDIIAIPPTSGDRTDVIGTSGKYYLDMTKDKFNEKVSKEDYFKQLGIKATSDKDKKRAIKNMEFTPDKIKDNIDLVIKITNGNIIITNKF